MTEIKNETQASKAVKSESKPKGAHYEKNKKLFIIVLSQKGGSGKSLFATSAGHIIRNVWKTKSAFFDADGSVGSFLIACQNDSDAEGIPEEEQNAYNTCEFYDIRNERDSDEILGRNTFLNSLDCKDADVILHDMAGGTLNTLSEIVDAGEGVDELVNIIEKYERRLVIVNMVDSSRASSTSVDACMSLFGNRADYVAVLNCRDGGTKKDFPYWYGFQSNGEQKYGGIRADFLEKFKGIEINMPQLPAVARSKMEGEDLTFKTAPTSNLLEISERGQISRYIRKVEENIETAGAGNYFGEQFKKVA